MATQTNESGAGPIAGAPSAGASKPCFLSNMKLKIATANTRMAKVWKNGEISWEDLNRTLENTHVTTETSAEYFKMTKGEQDQIKDVGGFVMGHLREGIRRSGHVLSRSAVVLDMDNGYPGVLDDLDMLYGFTYVAYGTHKCTPEKPRLRIIIPTSREMSEEEYPAVARMVAKEIGMDLFDDSTYEPHRLMYWPSTPKDMPYIYHRSDRDGNGKALLNPDEYLAKYDDWHDISTWPVSSRQSAVMKKTVSKQQDPLMKKGVVGAFCRAYPIQDAIELFLSDIYAPSAITGRFDYIPGESSAGVQIFDDKFAYSHHATDPACGHLYNAFDLVRIHKFPVGVSDDGDEAHARDEKQSFTDMASFAVQDPNVKVELQKERTRSAAADFENYAFGAGYQGGSNNGYQGQSPEAIGSSSAGSSGSTASGSGSGSGLGSSGTGSPAKIPNWQMALTYNSKGQMENTVFNEVLILANDPKLQNFGFNEMANMVQITGEVPWKRPNGTKFWRDIDSAQLKAYIDVHYTTFSERNFEVAFTKVTTDRKFHPIRDYFDSLPKWDGVERIPTLLIDSMQADDNDYVRAVTKKTLTAAVARIYHPGTKFDCMLVLDGVQGIGKSTIFKMLVGEDYYADTLSLTDMNDKSGAEKLQGFLVIEVAELAGMKKADIEKVKGFLSTSDDKYRPSYGHVVESHPRQCIIIGSVNGDRGYLRDVTGNRRFWVVKLHQEEQKLNFNITGAIRDQMWAEAKYYFESGEKLYLEGDLIEDADEAQKSAMESDDRRGMVESFLEMLLPPNWDMMDLFAKRQYVTGYHSDPTIPKGVYRRETVSNAEIWAECFGKDLASISQHDSYQIAAIMKTIDGWERSDQRKNIPGYGRQRLYVRVKPEKEDVSNEDSNEDSNEGSNGDSGDAGQTDTSKLSEAGKKAVGSTKHKAAAA